jgi:hypothetical protein
LRVGEPVAFDRLEPQRQLRDLRVVMTPAHGDRQPCALLINDAATHPVCALSAGGPHSRYVQPTLAALLKYVHSRGDQPSTEALLSV